MSDDLAMQQFSIYLLRHGQCQGGDILRGRTDVALTSLGQQQMQQALAKFEHLPSLIVTSPLQRCLHFCQLQWPSEVIHCVTQLAEFNFGDWDGQTYQQLYQDYPQQLDAFWQDPWHNPPPAGETMMEFELRVMQAWQHVLQLVEQQQQDALVVCHAGVIRFLLSYVLGCSKQVGFYNALHLPYAALLQIKLSITTDGQQFLQLCWPD